MVNVQTGNMLDVIIEGKSIGLKQRDSDHRKYEVIWLPAPKGLRDVLAAEIARLNPSERQTGSQLTSDEREERLKQIRKRQALNLPAADRLNPEYAEAVRDIDFLLSLLNSQATSRAAEETAADIVREWSEYDMNEAHDSAYLQDEFGAGHLEERIALALTDAATAMQTACVEKVKALPTDRRDDRRPPLSAEAFKRLVIETLESLQVEQEKQQS